MAKEESSTSQWVAPVLEKADIAADTRNGVPGPGSDFCNASPNLAGPLCGS